MRYALLEANLFSSMFAIHVWAVRIFACYFLIKLLVLFFTKSESYQRFRKLTMVPEMILSSVFLLTGIYLAFNSGSIGSGSWFTVKVAAIVACIVFGVIGFRKENKIMAVISVAFLVYAYGVAETHSLNFRKPVSETTTDSTKNSSSEKLSAAQLYSSNCASCHGTDGKAGLSGATDLSTSALATEDALSVVRDGRNTMPAFGQSLTKEQTKSLIDFILTLRTSK